MPKSKLQEEMMSQIWDEHVNETSKGALEEIYKQLLRTESR